MDQPTNKHLASLCPCCHEQYSLKIDEEIQINNKVKANIRFLRQTDRRANNKQSDPYVSSYFGRETQKVILTLTLDSEVSKTS